MLYHVYEMQRASLAPVRLMASHALSILDLPFSPWRGTPMGRLTAAALDSFEHSTRRFGKPEFGLKTTTIDGETVDVVEDIVHSATWCDLKRFRRVADRPDDHKVLLVAPMSGHYATLLRGTVKAFLPDHDVYITEWRDAREVPVNQPDFDLPDYIETVIGHLQRLGPAVHVIAVCQPSVPVLAAVAMMNEAKDPAAPNSITLIGGPVDTRQGITSVNDFAKRHSIDWFRRHVIHRVPYGHPGVMRRVYPGFLQLAGFMAMNLDRHVDAHWQMFQHLVDGDGETLASKRRFYEEYRAVMDLPADFYLTTIHDVFQEHLLPRGLLRCREHRVDPAAIEHTAIQTIEGERDDISGLGQTRAAHTITPNLADARREHWEQEGVGHYGLFNGQRFRADIAPRIKRFIQAQRR